MKRKMTFLAALATIVVLASACRVSETKDDVENTVDQILKTFDGIQSFERIKIDGVCNVIYSQGDETTVRVKYNKPEETSLVRVKSNGETLSIDVKDSRKKYWVKNRNKAIQVFVTSPDLIEVDMEGVGSFRSRGTLDTDTLRLRMDGAGSIKIPSLICDRLQAEMDGAGSISLADVTAQETRLEMDGVGSINVKNFKNSGSVYCKMDGVGSIELGGEVRNLRKKVDGVGSINTKKLKVRGE